MNKSGLDILKWYVRLINKKNQLFVILAIVITSFITVVAYIIPPKYEAQSTVLVEKNVITNLVEGVAVTPSLEDRLSVLTYSIKSRALLSKVITAMDMDTSNNIELLLEKLRDDTEIKIVDTSVNKSRKGMDLFIVSFKHRDPRVAMDYVNNLVNHYIEENMSNKRQESYLANNFLSDQIKYFKNKIDEIDTEIVQYRTENGVFVALDEGKVLQTIEDSEAKLEELRITKMELEARKKSIEDKLEKEPSYTVAVLGSERTIGDQLQKLQIKLNDLLTKYTVNYPEVIRIKLEIESLNQQLKSGISKEDSVSESDNALSTLNPAHQELKKELANTGFDITVLQTREKYLKQLIDTKKSNLKEIPTEKKKLADLEREKNSIKKIYEELIFRHGQSEVSKEMDIQDKSETYRIVDPAILPKYPVSPNRIKLILLALFAGVFGAAFLVINIDKLNNKVKDIEALKGLNIPVLGVIPKIVVLEEIMKERKRSIKMYLIGGFYILGEIGVLVREVIIIRLG